MLNPLDWYWLVAGDDTRAWSSEALDYVDTSDQVYQDWAAIEGNIATRIPSPQDLADVMRLQINPLLLGAGISVDVLSNPDTSATFALDDATVQQMHEVAQDFACGLGLPGSRDTFDYPDIDRIPHALTGEQCTILYRHMRDYLFSFNVAVAQRIFGMPSDLPSNDVEIP